MKKLQLLGLALVCFAIACKKSGNKINEPIENSLIGKWTYTEFYTSIADPGGWRPVSPPDQTIEFKSDGTFIPCQSFLQDANHFEIVDSVTVKIEPASTPSGFILMGYKIQPTDRELELFPVAPMCIEGCSNKFIR